MRILRPTLIGLTLGLSVVSVYLATVVATEHARSQDVAQQRREVTIRLEQLTRPASPTSPDTRAEAAAPSVATPAPTAAAASSKSATEEEDEHGAWGFASHAERLRELTNPALRAAMRIQLREDQRAAHPRLANELRLSEADADELFTILADQELRHEERYHRNRIAGRREYIDETQLDATAREDLRALLGPRGFRALLAFRDGLPERRRIDALTERLGRADALTASEASQLAQAMRQERAVFESELQRLQGDVRFRAGRPEDARLRGVEGPAQQQFGKSQVARIETFYARVRDRASGFLSPTQLQRLRQIQDERIAYVQSDYVWAHYVGPAEKAMEEANEASKAK